MVPNDWTPISFGEILEFRNGLNFTRGDDGEEVRIVGVGDFESRSQIKELSSLKKIRVRGEVSSADTLLSGDLLFVRSNGNKALIGRCLFFPRVTEKLSFSGFTIRGRVCSDDVIPQFLSYLAQSDSIRTQIQFLGGGTNISNLSQTILSKLQTYLPALHEQLRIVEILKRWDRAIETTEKLIENSKARKKALIQKLLAGAYKEGKTTKLGALFAERNEKNRLDLPLLSVTRNEGVLWRDEVGRKDTSSEDKSKYLRVCPGDISYNTMRMWQGVSALSDKEGIVSPAYTVVTPVKGIDPLFMSYLFKSPRMIHDFYRYSQGMVSDTWNLKFENFAKISVRVPDHEEQCEIAAILSDSDREIALLESIRNKLEHEKRALMQQLLTGKRRVKINEQESEVA